jgi:DNA-binding GntR family transcriptional regulator
VRDWIIVGELKPGESLNDQHIAEVLGVSRTPVREALQRLEDDGFVETAVNRWTRVAPLELTDVISVYKIVEVLDLLAFELARLKIDPRSFVGSLRLANEAMIEAACADDAQAAMSADEDFHRVWLSRAENPQLEEIIEKLKLKLQRAELAHFDGPARISASYGEHLAIIHSIELGDFSGCADAIKRNWQASLERIKSTCRVFEIDG